MTETLLKNEFWSISHDPLHRLVRITRTSKPLPVTLEDLSLGELERKISHIDRARSVLLLDMREAPLRNDPEFERLNSERNKWTSAFVETFARKAMLLKSAVGVLQVRRLQRERGNGPPAFLDEHEALVHLGVEQARAS